MKLLERATQQRNIVLNRQWREVEVVLYNQFIESQKQRKTVQVHQDFFLIFLPDHPDHPDHYHTFSV